ncbi:MAG: trypsin-like serine protease with C-terminal PDZ [Planctomycetota bacterium]|nr:MAG: trypsin-like serine protease with C-terminal PDZ [Planctomycetota bacterium]
MRRFPLAASAAAAIALAASLLAPAEQPKPSIVRFELEANLMWVDVLLDGKGPFRMVVDTGASTTVVLPGPAKEKGLVKKAGSGELFVEGTHFVPVAKVQVGALTVENLKVAIMSVPQIEVPAGLLELKADGVLGFNFLSRFVTTIDYKIQTISFLENDFVPPDPEISLPGITKGARCWFGVQVEEADPREVKSNGYDGGLLVNSVTELSPAEKAGIREGDIIVDIAGTPSVKPFALKDFLSRSAPGQKIVITFIRKGELWEADVVIGKVPERLRK